MTAAEENSLRTFERKILRKIFGPVKEENNEYRIRYNHEVLHLMGNEDIVRFIKAQRLRWMGHIERMSANRTPRRTYEAVCMSTRRRGRLRTRWSEEVEGDLRRMSVANWRDEARSRDGWRRVVLQAKAHPEL